MNTKLTLTIEKEVIQIAKAYAKEKGQSLSELVENYLKLSTRSHLKMFLLARERSFVFRRGAKTEHSSRFLSGRRFWQRSRGENEPAVAQIDEGDSRQ